MHLSPYLSFDRSSWRKFGDNMQIQLTEAELDKLSGQIESITLQEAEDFYLPLSRLLNLYVNAAQELHHVTSKFLNHPTPKTPYIIGVAGSVAVGKSTTSRILQALLKRWLSHNKVEIVTTDGFLYPNKILEERELMNRKGFPESFRLKQLIKFLQDVKAGKAKLKIPIYSHRIYDILPSQYKIIDQPDIIILEGLNVLQINHAKTNQISEVFVSDFFDFSIYVDAKTTDIQQWFMQRFMTFRQRAKTDKDSYFYRLSQLTDEEADHYAKNVWKTINEANLIKNILPYRERADLILKKRANHQVEKILLRKL